MEHAINKIKNKYTTVFLGLYGFLRERNRTPIVLPCCWLLFGIVHIIYIGSGVSVKHNGIKTKVIKLLY
jgi:hypothetical protein